MHAYRSHTCGELRKTDVGQTVKLSGWLHRRRDHGGVMFIDLRDHYGLTQCVFDPDFLAFAVVERLRTESVITIEGEVLARDADLVNPNLASGEIEVRVKEASVQSEAAELPLPVFGEPDYPEDIRLKHRYLDLRRETLHANMILRAEVIASIRRRMVEQGFTEYQTPILTASSPEGARDFLVPSRLHPGEFYALPQAPQQFKQLLMVSGFDRYFQIAACFRDEDARADRSPGEFYQLDIEMSFVTQEDVFQAIEPVMHGVFAEFADWKGKVEKFPKARSRAFLTRKRWPNTVPISQTFATQLNWSTSLNSSKMTARPAFQSSLRLSKAAVRSSRCRHQRPPKPSHASSSMRWTSGQKRNAGPRPRLCSPARR